jgi:hypothetical protein
MVGLFMVAALVTVAAVIPALALGGRRTRMLADGSESAGSDDIGWSAGTGPARGGERSVDGPDEPSATLAL